MRAYCCENECSTCSTQPLVLAESTLANSNPLFLSHFLPSKHQTYNSFVLFPFRSFYMFRMPKAQNKRLRNPSPAKLRKSLRLQRNPVEVPQEERVQIANLEEAMAYIDAPGPPAAEVLHLMEEGMPPPLVAKARKGVKKVKRSKTLDKSIPATPLTSILDERALHSLFDEDPAGLLVRAQEAEMAAVADTQDDVRKKKKKHFLFSYHFQSLPHLSSCCCILSRMSM